MSRMPIVWDRDISKWCVMRGREVVKSFPTLLAAEEFVLSLKSDDAC